VSNTAPFFSPLSIGGQIFDFRHLDPFTMSFNSQMASKDLRVNVRFSNHCFTHSPLDHAVYPPEIILTDHSNRERIFCQTRYQLSHMLGAVVRGLNNPQCKVHQTASKRNFNYSLQIDNPKGPYHLFFEVSKTTGQASSMQDLNLFVESAYPEMPIGEPPALLGRIGFQLLCSKVFLKQPISTKR
jgi:hypothetical protein